MSDNYNIIGILPKLCCCRSLFNRSTRNYSERNYNTRDGIRRLIKGLPKAPTANYLKNDMLAPLWRTMRLHPSYGQCFIQTHHFLMSEGNGPLSASDRHYIAIMAASMHSCKEIVVFHEKEFISSAGDEKWIKEGLESASRKMIKLNDVNIMLAHQPWRLTKYHIKELTSGNRGDNWSISEVIEAMTLLCHFHALSSFVMGCVGMEETLKEEDYQERSRGVPGLEERDLADKKLELELSEIIIRCEEIDWQGDSELFGALLSDPKYSNLLVFLKKRLLRRANTSKYKTFYQDHKYDNLAHELEEEKSSLLLRDFSWPVEGYCTMRSLHSDELAGLLDKKFNVAMMDNSSNGQTLETLRNYCRILLKVQRDDYDYEAIRQLLNKNFQSYIKAMTCYPEHCIVQDYLTFMSDLKNIEKVHLCLMVSESRFQNELMFALNAITSSFKS